MIQNLSVFTSASTGVVSQRDHCYALYTPSFTGSAEEIFTRLKNTTMSSICLKKKTNAVVVDENT